MKEQITDVVCKWIGNGEGCRHPSMYKKSYCEDHYSRVYMSVHPDIADLVVDKELESILNNKS